MTIARHLLALSLVVSTVSSAQALRPDQAAFRELYKELVETNTTLSAGSCTLAAAQLATRLRTAGFTDADLTPFAISEKPKEGGLVAILQGSDRKARPMLLLAHIDVVEAKREDWTRDPFTLIEEDGYFYARGASDDKAQAAIFTDILIRMKASGVKPRRAVKLALTCGEETNGAFNGAEYLAANKRDLIDAAFALNEGGGGRLTSDGKPNMLALQVGEKMSHNYVLETINKGGHSSMPRPDNAIYSLVGAVAKVRDHVFPVVLTTTTRAFFTKMSTAADGPGAAAMAAIVANPQDAAAAALLSKDPSLNSTLRTTCVTTLLDAGHAENALPQRARANVNCRIIPGETIDGTRDALERIIGDTAVKVTPKAARGPLAKAPPLDPAIVGPIEALAARFFPGIPVVPVQSTGASDAVFLAAVGIPTYGVPGIFYDADGGGIHGLNERIRVKSVYDGRDYLFELVKIFASTK